MKRSFGANPVDVYGGVQKELGALSLVGEGVTFESEKQKMLGLNFKTQRSPSQIKPILPVGMPRTGDSSVGGDDKNGRLPAFIQV